jgi:predicted AlkP superfamily phosphohydrolase/phosphomutase
MRTIILGFDAFDPTIFERLLEAGRMPNLASFVEIDGYSRLRIANPAQTEVSWTSIATGQDPGGHGIFDFVHRDPATYAPQVSLLATKKGVGGTQFIPPFSAPTFFDQTVRDGYPATALFWPAMFPARYESPVRTIPGLGTPDILGKLGVGAEYRSGALEVEDGRKTPLRSLSSEGQGRYSGRLLGPSRKKRGGVEETRLPFELSLDGDSGGDLRIAGQRVALQFGRWSPIIELSFKVGLLFKVHAITQVVLTRGDPETGLYFLPLQIHPLHSAWRYATPKDFVRASWEAGGKYLSLGWPQDTTGLEEGCMTDEQFLGLCDSIFEKRERIFMHHLTHFEEGLLAGVFDSMDRVQHMFLRDRDDIVARWYVKLDGLVGRVRDALRTSDHGETHILVMSDHGFRPFHHKVHLNRWLIEGGYLKPKEGESSISIANVDWDSSQAYAFGLNSLYINLQGREGKGSVPPDQREALLSRLSDDLLAWEGPDGGKVVGQVARREQALRGPLAEYGPDLLVGYAPGYRASSQTGMGSWESDALEANRDHWGADHCIDPRAVPGVLFSNRGLAGLSEPSFRDIPQLVTGKALEGLGEGAPPPSYSEEDQEVVEERLRSLGYF